MIFCSNFFLSWVQVVNRKLHTIALDQPSAIHQPEKLENYLYEEVEIKSSTLFWNFVVEPTAAIYAIKEEPEVKQ